MKTRRNIIRVEFREPPEFDLRHVGHRAVAEVRGQTLENLKAAAAVAGVSPRTLLRRALRSVFSEQP